MMRTPSRAEVQGDGVEMFKPGARNKADLLLMDLGQGPIVVKDFGRKSWWVRRLGQLQISREFRAYRWLGALPGIPRLVGRVDRHAIALEKIEGTELGLSPERWTDGAVLFPRIVEILGRIHARGLVHLDLRTRDNVILRPGGELCIIDFASAFWFRPGGLAHRLFFRRLCHVDHSAVLKWKEMLQAGPYTEQEQAFLRRHRFWRALWVFNPKPSESKRKRR